MSTIVTRAGKGSPLTNTEVDSNFTNLNTDKAELDTNVTFNGIDGGKITSTRADNGINFHAISTDADENNGPIMDFERISASPADGDNTGVINFKGRNDAGQTAIYAQFFTEIVDASDGSEDGRIEIRTLQNGTVRPGLTLFTNNGQPEVSVNGYSADLDFRVKGSAQGALIFADASENKVGIKTGTPTADLHVNGTLATGITTIVGTPASTDDSPLTVNRVNNDGALLNLQQAGIDQLKVYSTGGNSPIIANGGGNGFILSPTVIKPRTSANAALDAVLDLGASDARFKDFYLSGGAYLGGTDDSNKLDDYETGNWTCGIQNSAESQTSSTTRIGTYTKVGRVVHVSVNMNNIDASTFTGGSLRITGLPFVINSSSGARGHGVCQVNDFVDSNAHYYYIQGVQGTNKAQIKYNKNNDTAHSIDVTKLNSGNTSAIIFDLTYIV